MLREQLDERRIEMHSALPHALHDRVAAHPARVSVGMVVPLGRHRRELVPGHDEAALPARTLLVLRREPFERVLRRLDDPLANR